MSGVHWSVNGCSAWKDSPVANWRRERSLLTWVCVPPKFSLQTTKLTNIHNENEYSCGIVYSNYIVFVSSTWFSAYRGRGTFSNVLSNPVGFLRTHTHTVTYYIRLRQRYCAVVSNLFVSVKLSVKATARVASSYPMAMELKKRKVLVLPTTLQVLLSEDDIVVTYDIILYMAEYLKFEDYRSFIRAFWPAYGEDAIFQNKLWQLSTHKIEVIFLNKKRVKIEYNFDPSRQQENRILFNVETLKPIFGWVVPPGGEEFVGTSKLQNFIRMHVHLNMCSQRQYAACLCHQLKCDTYIGVRIVKPPEVTCRWGHFHHYCSQHVKNWLNMYLIPYVLLQQQPSFMDEDIANSFLEFMSNSVHLGQGWNQCISKRLFYCIYKSAAALVLPCLLNTWRRAAAASLD